MSGISLYAPQRLMIGDPGPALKVGLWQQVLEQISAHGIDPFDGYTISVEYEGATYPVTGIKSRAGNAVHCDNGVRDLGEYETDTQHLAIMPAALCCANPYFSHARWIETTETTSGYTLDGVLTLKGSELHCSINTVPAWARTEMAQAAARQAGELKKAA